MSADVVCGNECPTPCRSVFDRVVVSYLIAGLTRVSWQLLPTFLDKGPLEFTLQIGQNANPYADDWEDVGLPVTDQYSAYDPEQRAWGKTNWTHYRVKLVSSENIYYSDPVGAMGTLDRRMWLKAREIIRQRRKAYRLGTGGQPGYLLKRRWSGQPCKMCLDHQTLEVRDPYCGSCFGTGFECGYYYPTACTYAEMSPRSRRTELDGGQGRGTIDDIVVKTEMIMTDLLSEEDVWVGAKTDDRYFVHRVEHTAEVKGVPLIAQVELRLIAFSHVIYSIAIPEQLAAIGLE